MTMEWVVESEVAFDAACQKYADLAERVGPAPVLAHVLKRAGIGTHDNVEGRLVCRGWRRHAGVWVAPNSRLAA
jgi:hypothetical protein